MIITFLKRNLAALLMFAGVSLFAQTLNINQFGIEEGLPQSTISTLLTDSSGNIWMGTMGGGICKYDGINFKVYSYKNGLPENRITSGALDKNGNIWFGHSGGHLSFVHVKSRKIKEVIPAKIEISKPVNCVLQTKDGVVWFGTAGLGLLKYTPTDAELNSDTTAVGQGTFVLYTENEGLAGNFVNAIAQDKNGMVYVATQTGVSKFAGGAKPKFELVIGLPFVNATAVLFDSKSNTWIGSEDKGIYRTGPSGNRSFTTKEGLSSNNIRVMLEDASGDVFIGTLGGGVSKYLYALEANDYKGSVFQTISTVQGLSNDRVLSIIQDREKNIWIGTYLNLNQYFDEQFEIYGHNEGLDASLIWSVVEDRKGSIWLGTDGGVYKMNRTANSNQNSFTNYYRGKAEISNTTALHEDTEGYIWFSDFANGASRLDPESKKVTTYTTKDGLANDEVYTICSDKDGNVWIGSKKDGVSKFDIKTKKIQKYTLSNGLGSNSVYVIFNDSKSRLWFGCLGGNLTVYDGANFKQISKEEYPSLFTVSITEDPAGNIWMGTYGQGIFKYDGKSFTQYSTKEGLSSETPFLLQSDLKNNLWIGTGLGMDKLNFADQSFKHYTKQDGFLGIEINPNASCRDKDGNLWFGTIIGVVKYTSRFEKNNQAEPITYLKNPRLFYEEVAIPDDHVFSYNQNHFTFDFVGASLTNPKKVKYMYKLEGHEKDWSRETKLNTVTFSNLAPGSYTFMVKAANNDGVWNKEPVTFSFTIKPPFYKSWWFITLCVVAIAATVWSYMKYREAKLQQRNRVLEQTVTERTQELVIKNQEIAKKNANITDSIDYAKRIQEAIFVPDESIKALLPEHFILFKPKDIVSGDFYWTIDLKDKNKVLFAAADCTGHGVPGAFMSIIGCNLLNYIVRDLGITKPSEVLNKLNDLVGETLNSGQDGNKVKDGMDISFCLWDKSANKLEFAGAYNPLYLIRNKELVEYKADKLPVGKSQLHTNEKFTNTVIDLQKGDMIYIFSDGYADQIGGSKRKKFYYGQFKEVLANISTQGMEQQRQALDRAIVEWLGGREQLDDIIVFGVKV